MNNLSQYIIEKLHIDKNSIKNKEHSLYEDIYDIHPGDKGIIMNGIKKLGDIYVDVFPVQVTEIEDKKLKFTSLSSKSINYELDFCDYKKLPPISKAIAFYHKQNQYWYAFIKKDDAIGLINTALNRYKKGNITYFGTFRLNGKYKRDMLNNLLDELKED